MGAMLVAAEPNLKLAGFVAQNRTNTAQALTQLVHHDAAFMNALLVAAELKLHNFGAQDLSNTMLALAKLEYEDAAFMGALLVAATPKPSQCQGPGQHGVGVDQV